MLPIRCRITALGYIQMPAADRPSTKAKHTSAYPLLPRVGFAMSGSLLCVPNPSRNGLTSLKSIIVCVVDDRNEQVTRYKCGEPPIRDTRSAQAA
jgi:hypothetical protein